MKNIFLLYSFILLSFAEGKKKKIVFFGDSITELGVKPGGYIVKMDSMLNDNYELVGADVSSDKIYDLYLRLDEDVLKQRPDIVIIFIGVNDVWHKRLLGTGTDPEKFRKFYSAILKKLSDNKITAIICTPAAIGEKKDFTNELDEDLNKYSNIIRDLAAKNSVPIIDLRQIFLEYNLKNNPENKDRGILTRDGVHLNEAGNQLLADEMWKVISKL